MKPIIGITCGEIQNKVEPWSPITYGQSHTYVDAVVRAGGVPLLLPLTDDQNVLRQLYELCGGMLFAGGNDIDPARYGEATLPQTKDISVKRDTQELQLLAWTLADDKPVFAICRGMQLLNSAKGGTLYQDIASQIPAASDHEDSTKNKDITHVAHQLRITPDSQLGRIAGTKLATNSHHHQAIKKLGTSLTACAWSEDGTIEAIELQGRRFVLGVQSHPESLDHIIGWRHTFEAFVAASMV